MTAEIQVIDPEVAPLCVERIFVNGSGDLRALVSGVECSVAARADLVAAGFVLLEPLDHEMARRRPIFSRLNVSKFTEQFWCVAADARLVNAARRYNALRAHGAPLAEHIIWPTAAQE